MLTKKYVTWTKINYALTAVTPDTSNVIGWLKEAAPLNMPLVCKEVAKAGMLSQRLCHQTL